MAKISPKMVNKYATVSNGVPMLHHSVEPVDLPPDAIELTDEEHLALAVGAAKIEDGKVVPV